MKSYSIRIPEELLERLRAEAARQTLKRKGTVSMNTLALEILDKGLRDKKKGG